MEVPFKFNQLPKQEKKKKRQHPGFDFKFSFACICICICICIICRMAHHKNLLAQLEAMGFSEPRAIKALHFSGNTSVEAAIDWMIDHDNETDIDYMPLVIMDIPIEEPNPSKVPYHKSNASKWEVKKEEERRSKERILQKLQQDKAERKGIVALPNQNHALVKPDVSINHKKNKLKLVDFARKVELMEECLRSLRGQNIVSSLMLNSKNDAQVKTAFKTLLIYVTNVANFPDNVRLRRIHLTNPAFQKRVGNFKEGVEFLQLCGFVKAEREELLFLPRDKIDMGLLKEASALLHSAITNPFFGLLSRKL